MTFSEIVKTLGIDTYPSEMDGIYEEVINDEVTLLEYGFELKV